MLKNSDDYTSSESETSAVSESQTSDRSEVHSSITSSVDDLLSSKCAEEPDYMKKEHFRFELPEFKTDLFSGEKVSKEVDTEKYDDLIQESQNQLDEKLQEEERKLKEAEELLKSLGIDI